MATLNMLTCLEWQLNKEGEDDPIESFYAFECTCMSRVLMH